jgi:molecular chaperone HscB
MTRGTLYEAIYRTMSNASVQRISSYHARAAAAAGRRCLAHRASSSMSSSSGTTASSAVADAAAVPASHFALLGVPESFDVSLDDLSAAHRRLQREWHPDRYANADEPARQRAAQLSASINDAYAALKAPATRASHLLAIRASRMGDQGTGGGTGVDTELLQWAMTVRERIDEAAGQPRELADMRDEAAEKIRACCRQLGDAFGQNDLARAREETTRLLFLHRMHAAADDQLSALEKNS